MQFEAGKLQEEKAETSLTPCQFTVCGLLAIFDYIDMLLAFDNDTDPICKCTLVFSRGIKDPSHG